MPWRLGNAVAAGPHSVGFIIKDDTGREVGCAISREALELHFGLESTKLRAAFDANLQRIVEMAGRKADAQDAWDVREARDTTRGRSVMLTQFDF